MESAEAQDLREISLDTINMFIKEEQKDDEDTTFQTALDEDMLTINFKEAHSFGIVKRISDGYYLPQLYELWIDYLNSDNDHLASLLQRNCFPIDGLYINYKVSHTYKIEKVNIGPYYEALLNMLQYVRDR